MPAPIHVVLTAEEDRTLAELRVATRVPQRTRDRAHMIRLNAQGWRVPVIAKMFECHEHTVRATLQRWEQGGLGGLWEVPGRGAKPTWEEVDFQAVEQWIEQDARTYNSHQLAQKLAHIAASTVESETSSLCATKKGNRRKRTRQSHRSKQDPEQKRLKTCRSRYAEASGTRRLHRLEIP